MSDEAKEIAAAVANPKRWYEIKIIIEGGTQYTTIWLDALSDDQCKRYVAELGKAINEGNVKITAGYERVVV